MTATADVALVIVTGRGKFGTAAHPRTPLPCKLAAPWLLRPRAAFSSSLPGSAAQQLPPHPGQHVGDLLEQHGPE